jgi:hypothetical protein
VLLLAAPPRARAPACAYPRAKRQIAAAKRKKNGGRREREEEGEAGKAEGRRKEEGGREVEKGGRRGDRTPPPPPPPQSGLRSTVLFDVATRGEGQRRGEPSRVPSPKSGSAQEGLGGWLLRRHICGDTRRRAARGGAARGEGRGSEGRGSEGRGSEGSRRGRRVPSPGPGSARARCLEVVKKNKADAAQSEQGGRAREPP